MNKPLLLALSLALIAPIYAGQHDDKVEMFVNMMKRDPQLKAISSCLGISEAKVIAATRQTLNSCIKLFSNDNSERFEQCMEQTQTKELRALSPKFDLCEAKYDTDEEESREFSQEQALEAMQELLGHTKDQGAGTEGLITLPIYHGATIMMHFQDGMEVMGVKTLPVASLKSNASIKQISDYYKKNLPDFESRLSSGTYQFAKKLPSRELNFIDFTRQYSQMPHVSVSEAMDHSGSRLIEISYSKR